MRLLVGELYVVQPKIFTKLNSDQKKTFVGLLRLLLNSDERENLLNILSEILELSKEDRKELANLLTESKLKNVMKTIKLISNRYKIVMILKELVFNSSLNANERDHLQNLISNNYWIFGEKYNLASADESFERTLRNYLHILDGGKKEVHFNDPNRLKRMDIFICRRDISENSHNIIVELKHPKKRLGENEVSQVKDYMWTIKRTDEFNDPNTQWEFILVGNKYDNTGYIQDELENSKHHGIPGVILKTDNYTVYVKTWSQIISGFEQRHDFLNKKLQIEKNNLITGRIEKPDQLIKIADSLSIG